VKTFWDYLDRSAGSDAQRRKLLAAKMVGRWPNGAPLVQHPDREPVVADMEKANDFWYKDDLAGDRCPVGAHIRRSNPRDGLYANRADSLIVSNRHRLLRRGRAYGAPLAPSLDPDDFLAVKGDSGDRGLHFVCFNTDLARQFEFVQNTWINSMKFDGLYGDPDPIAAPHVAPSAARHPEEVANFTIQACPVRQRVTGLPPVVTMIGGAYLFMPGLKTLRFLAQA
jgi:deferrochelatase/peroxidase EfeB